MPGFLKQYSSASQAAESLRRTDHLLGQSVKTPSAKPGPTPSALEFDAIEGRTGHDLIRHDLRPLLQAVSKLHEASVPDLGRYDPLLRIRPRLAATDLPALRQIAAGPVPRGTATLHGDLHVGQFIVTPDDVVWLVDLDDLAIGPPEADLANFAAHLATTEHGLGIAEWSFRVRDAWANLGHACDAYVFACYLHLALLRRHLKLREAGRQDFKARILSYLRESSSFSMR